MTERLEDTNSTRPTLLTELMCQLDIDSVLCWKNSHDITNQQIANQKSLYHGLVEGLHDHPDLWSKGRRLIYWLDYMGVDINNQDETGNTPLHRYLASSTVNVSVLEALLQCNADMYVTNGDGRTPLMLGLLTGGFVENIRDVLIKYAPGMKRSIESNNIMNVRKLINQSCSVNAFSTEVGTCSGMSEQISRLLSDIAPSMALLHAAMAGDVDTVRHVLQTSRAYNINLHNMGHHGCTAIYYALCTNQLDLVHLLLAHSARPDIDLTIDGEEVAMLVRVLHSKVISKVTLMHLFGQLSPVTIQQISHKGDGVLEAGMRAGLDPELLRVILERGGADIVTRVDSKNLSVRQQSERVGHTDYTDVIDKMVHRWCTDQAETTHRRRLALRGYRHFPLITSGDEMCGDVAEFFIQLPQYLDKVREFHESVLLNDLSAVQQNVLCPQFSKHFDACLADSCTDDSPQPALFKAVLRGHRDITRLLGESIVYLKGEHVDSIRDHYMRTALHYAMASEDRDDISSLLKSLGASENALDKNGQTPLSFLDRRRQPLMQRLLIHHQFENWDEAEPDPWSEHLPLPIISYLTRRRHDATPHESVTQSLQALAYHTHGHTHKHPDTSHAHTDTDLLHAHRDSDLFRSQSHHDNNVDYAINNFMQNKQKFCNKDNFSDDCKMREKQQRTFTSRESQEHSDSRTENKSPRENWTYSTRSLSEAYSSTEMTDDENLQQKLIDNEESESLSETESASSEEGTTYSHLLSTWCTIV